MWPTPAASEPARRSALGKVGAVSAGTLGRAQELLEALAGPAARLRADQAAAIEAVVDHGRRVLVVQRTGWGKSLTYFASAKIRRERGRGPALMVSPLLALMRDQIAAAEAMGLSAITINSSNQEDWGRAEDALRADTVDLLAISPERLNNPGFVADVLPGLADRVGLLILDEAHCISAWGHDFRPDYLRIRTALARLPPGTPVLATTATATSLVVDDVAGQLGVEPLTLRGSLERDSLALSVVARPAMADRMAWMASNIADMTGSGIVYTLTQAAATQTAAWLRSTGIEVEAYTGATPPEERLALEAALRVNDVKALVATSALGMGYDKPDLGFVINVGAPSSITAYYQMVGRAGRALDHAEAVLLPGEEDARIWRYFDSVSFPPRHQAESVVRTLEAAPRPLSEAIIETRVDIRHNRLATMLKVLDVEGAARRVKGGWERTTSPWAYDDERYARVATARVADQDLMVAYERSGSCRMAFLRRSLDDPELEPDWRCGRCDNCRSRAWVEPPPGLADTVRRRSRVGPIVLDARKMWPAGLGEPKGRIPEGVRALDGRAMSEAGSSGWDRLARAALDHPDAEPDAALVNAIVDVVGGWRWPDGQPTWVSWVPSTRRPRLVRALAERVGAVVGRPVLPVVTRVTAGYPQADQGNSAHACRNVWGAFAFDAGPVPAGPGVVVDDIWASGWTMTVVADLIAAKGCGPVYPFVLQKGR
ncbi:MAG: DEAD/DEAH box helicase [Actinomycetota bacterium]|nr:DEAD/DEAH box helicase [Actinomycetota bacterium]